MVLVTALASWLIAAGQRNVWCFVRQIALMLKFFYVAAANESLLYGYGMVALIDKLTVTILTLTIPPKQIGNTCQD
ncbi:hypothetical protein DU002_04575 [Corallincola holothuriorum]|uniref:Uncharacterized protein n=1 Tax=Corallincola holothuriorum TaxID=2282215 RepID=A0A368NNS0_9GAMM|nr:hypothetical protein DU002_04575 [Corallincola holothuriorum]